MCSMRIFTVCYACNSAYYARACYALAVLIVNFIAPGLMWDSLGGDREGRVLAGLVRRPLPHEPVTSSPSESTAGLQGGEEVGQSVRRFAGTSLSSDITSLPSFRIFTSPCGPWQKFVRLTNGLPFVILENPRERQG